MPVSDKAYASMEKAELDAYKKAVEENARLKAKLSGGSSPKKSGAKSGSKKSHSIVIAGEKLRPGEVRELAEKGLALQNRKENEAERNAKTNAIVKQFKDQLAVNGLTGAFMGWAEKKLSLWQRIPNIGNHPASRHGIVAVVLYYLAEKETDPKMKLRYMSMAQAAVTLAGEKFGQNFDGANALADKINEKTSLVPAVSVAK